MPRLGIDMFDETPKVGDRVKVMGKVDSIDEETGEVEVTYGDVSIVDKKKRKKRRNNDNDDDFEEVVYTQDETMDPQMNPNSQSLDSALARAFPNTQ